MKHRIAIISLCAAMLGCAMGPYVQNSPDVKKGELVEVKTHTKDFFSMDYNVFITRIVNSDNDVLFQSGFWKSAIGSAKLESGIYVITVECNSGYLVAHPSVQVALEKGKRYELYCSAQKGKNSFGMSVDSRAHAHIREI